MYKPFHRYIKENKCYCRELHNLFSNKMLWHYAVLSIVFSFLRKAVDGFLEETIQREVKCTVK
jgi:hypothetical protein